MFKTFEVTGVPFSVIPGTVMKLSQEQARRRRDMIDEGRQRGTHVARVGFQFKVGEKVTLDPATAALSEKFLAQIQREAAEAEAAEKAAAEAARLARKAADEEAARAAEEEAARAKVPAVE